MCQHARVLRKLDRFRVLYTKNRTSNYGARIRLTIRIIIMCVEQYTYIIRQTDNVRHRSTIFKDRRAGGGGGTLFGKLYAPATPRGRGLAGTQSIYGRRNARDK